MNALAPALLHMPIDADWLAALRHLENRSAAKPVGEFFPPSQEALSLRASIGLIFPATAIVHSDVDASYVHNSNGDSSAIAARDDAAADVTAQAHITSPLLGLSGPLAALPYHYTEALQAAGRSRNQAALDFFDIFNHRAQSLLYRALRKHRFVLDKERALARGGHDRYSLLLEALCGHLEPERATGDTTAHALPRDAWTSFAGLFASRIRSANNLEQLLRHYFQLDITIEQFSGRWVDIENESRCRLASLNNNTKPSLGDAALLGRRSWQAAAFFGVVVRHPDAAQLAQLAMGQPMRTTLRSLIRAFVGDEYGFHVDIITNTRVQCTARLSCAPAVRDTDTESVTRLGWLGVLGSMSPAQTATIRINHPTAARMQR